MSSIQNHQLRKFTSNFLKNLLKLGANLGFGTKSPKDQAKQDKFLVGQNSLIVNNLKRRYILGDFVQWGFCPRFVKICGYGLVRAWLCITPRPPPPSSYQKEASIERLGQVARALRGRRPRHQADMQVRALLCQVPCATMLGCMRCYIELLALLHQVACTTILGFVHYYIRLCALLCWVACATILRAIH